MQFLIADTFTDSLACLTGDEQKAVKTSSFDLQINPAAPGLKFHRVEKARDKNFWSIRANSDVRIIVHKTADTFVLCYADHHDKAYAWAERRKLETHPTTGAAQLVEIRETIQEIIIPAFVNAPVVEIAKPPLFVSQTDDELLSYGVPPEWLGDVRTADEDSLLALVEHLPAEAAEALLELATGGQPRVAPVTPTVNPFEHPDARRRFRVLENVEELEHALESAWEKWTVFLHPEQRETVEKAYSGPARVAGSAGTGKTIVALHRAAHLAHTHPEARVLLATFSEPLAYALRTRLRRLIGNEPKLGERIDVDSLTAVALRLQKAYAEPVKLASNDDITSAIRSAAQKVEHKFALRFLLAEWEQVVDAWQLKTWESYRDVARLGRKTRLAEPQRKLLWSIFSEVIADLEKQGVRTAAGVFTDLATLLKDSPTRPYDFAVVDEAQDLSVAQLKFLAALGQRPDALFFAGDLGQRIFQLPFSWKSLGVDIRGRSRTLRVNYRTSHQIRRHADRLLDAETSDVDGNVEDRSGTVSVFNGPPPTVRECTSEQNEIDVVAAWLKKRAVQGVLPHEIAVFVRSDAELDRATSAAIAADMPFKQLDQHVETVNGHVSISTMHLAKGLEFRAVVVMCCDDEVIPSQSRIEAVGDTADLQDIYETERQLLYVACTRARDYLLVTSAEPASEFLADMSEQGSKGMLHE